MENSAQENINRRYGTRPESSEEEGFATKALREVQLLAGGTWSGIFSNVRDVPNDPVAMAKLAGTVAVGAGLAALQTRVAAMRPVMTMLGSIGTANLAHQVVGQAPRIGDAMAATWRSADNYDQSKQVIGDTLGGFVADSAMMAVAGFGGMKAAERVLMGPNGNFVRLPTLHAGRSITYDTRVFPRDGAVARLYDDAGDTVVGINVTDVARLEEGSAGIGTGFLVGNNRIATNAHVVGGRDSFSVTTRNGDYFNARLVARDDPNDLAILEITGKVRQTHPLREVRLGSTPDSPEEVVAIGYPMSNVYNRMFVSPGVYERSMDTRILLRDQFDPAKPYGHNVVKDVHVMNLADEAALANRAAPPDLVPGRKYLPDLTGGQLTSLRFAEAQETGVFSARTIRENFFKMHLEGGNSGGPVFNMRGEVVGIASVKEGYGTSRAVPVEALKRLLSSLES